MSKEDNLITRSIPAIIAAAAAMVTGNGLMSFNY
jgi:hypothetical protein